MLKESAQRLLKGLGTLRPRWVWVLFALGLPWLLLPFPKAGCIQGLSVLSALCFWFSLVVLASLGLGWAWRRLLFKVSRRLWVILLLVSVLPALTLTTFFVALGWLGLGAQISRSIRGSFTQYEQALKLAGEERSDRVALQSIQVLGDAWISHTDSLPEVLEAGVPALIYTQVPDHPDQKHVFLRVATRDERGFRLLTLTLRDLAEASRKFLGGRIHYRLDWSRQAEPEDEKPKPKKRRSPMVKKEGSLSLEGATLLSQQPPVAAFIQGEVVAGSGLLRPFRLPPVSVRAFDWESGRPMVLSLQPETSLKEIFLGFGFGEGNLSAQAFLAMVLLITAVVFLGCFQAVALLMGLGLARSLGRSVEGLHRGVQQLAQGDFAARIKPRSRDQVAQLALAFNEMAANLERAQSEREERFRMEEELRLAREVQMCLLPDVAALAPAIRATILPAREVAGDFFDLARLSDGRHAFFIADVSGKGTSAAFYAAETKGVLSALDKAKLDPRQVLSRLNELWCAGHRPRLFMTAIYGTFDPLTGSFAFARAGHPPAFLRRADGRIERLKPAGLGIGLSATQFATSLELLEGQLEATESLILYTDGLTEAQAPDESFYGEDRLAEALKGEGDPRTLILRSVEEFLQGRMLEDDLTLLVLQR